MAAVNLGSKFLRGNLQDGVLTVTLDRPERRNACTIEMYHGIKEAAVIAEKDPGVDVLLITGTGDVFCPGGDMGSEPESGSYARPRDRPLGHGSLRAARALLEDRRLRGQRPVPGRWPRHRADERRVGGERAGAIPRPRAVARHRRLLALGASGGARGRGARQVSAVLRRDGDARPRPSRWGSCQSGAPRGARPRGGRGHRANPSDGSRGARSNEARLEPPACRASTSECSPTRSLPKRWPRAFAAFTEKRSPRWARTS